MPPFLTPPPDPNPRKPKLKLPPGTVDTQMHLFGPSSRYKVDPETRYVSNDATAEMYIELMKVLGITMGVFVPASPHGTDPTHLYEALVEHGDIFRGIAILPEGVTRQEIVRLDKVGVRGARFQSAAHGSKLPGLSIETAELIHEFGWHVQYFPAGTELAEMEATLKALPNIVAIDHFASIPSAGGLDQPAFHALLRLLDTGKVYVRLSRPMQLNREEDPPYPSATPFARAIVAHAPERVVWATDWPHVGMVNRVMPNDGDLVDWLLDWIPDEKTRNLVLVDNPDVLYRLDGAAKRLAADG